MNLNYQGIKILIYLRLLNRTILFAGGLDYMEVHEIEKKYRTQPREVKQDGWHILYRNVSFSNI